MARHALWGVIVLTGGLLLACGPDTGTERVAGGGGGTVGPDPTLQPSTFPASVNPTLPPGYSLQGETPYRWQAYFRYEGAWLPAGRPQATASPSTTLVIDCNDPELLDACSLHRPAMIEVTVADLVPGPALLCGYKSGFRFRDDFLLNTPIGIMSLAPEPSSSQDQRNQGICFP